MFLHSQKKKYPETRKIWGPTRVLGLLTCKLFKVKAILGKGRLKKPTFSLSLRPFTDSVGFLECLGSHLHDVATARPLSLFTLYHWSVSPSPFPFSLALAIINTQSPPDSCLLCETILTKNLQNHKFVNLGSEVTGHCRPQQLHKYISGLQHSPATQWLEMLPPNPRHLESAKFTVAWRPGSRDILWATASYDLLQIIRHDYNFSEFCLRHWNVQLP